MYTVYKKCVLLKFRCIVNKNKSSFNMLEKYKSDDYILSGSSSSNLAAALIDSSHRNRNAKGNLRAAVSNAEVDFIIDL